MQMNRNIMRVELITHLGDIKGTFFWAYSGITGSDMSVINSGPKRKNYFDHSSYSYSGIGPKERALNMC